MGRLSLWMCEDSRVTQVLGLGGLRSFFVSNFFELLNFSGNSLSPLTEGAAKGRPDRIREIPARAGRGAEGPGTALRSGPVHWARRPPGCGGSWFSLTMVPGGRSHSQPGGPSQLLGEAQNWVHCHYQRVNLRFRPDLSPRPQPGASGRTTGHLVPGCGLKGSVCLWAAREPEFRASQLCCVDRQPGVCRNRSRFLTQNLFGKMADILEKIKK